MTSNNRDQIYRSQQKNVRKFTFDNNVAGVFEDMISRSVPGYQQILDLLPTLVKRYYIKNAHYYDLGCSLGAGMIAMASGLSKISENENNTKIVGIDSSQEMLDKAKPLIEQAINNHFDFQLHCADICEFELDPAAIVLMNFTLQFVPLDQRDNLIQSIYNKLLPGGALVLSEKIRFSDQKTNQTLIDIHHQFKADQGYSDLEISQKRDAIEDVLIPETLATHSARLKQAGFSVVTPWIQNLQFISILAVK